MTANDSATSWLPSAHAPAFDPAGIAELAHAIREPACLLRDPASGGYGLALGGSVSAQTEGSWPLIGTLPPLYPEWLGDRSFNELHGTRFAYVAGAMANGIASTQLVSALAKQRILAFFGAAGLSLPRVEAAVAQLQRELDPHNLPWGANLIHSPAEPALEEAVADLFLRRGVRCVEASAYLALTPAVVRYACSGLSMNGDGQIRRKNWVFAKISRPEVARHFLQPPPQAMLDELVSRGLLSSEEARLGAQLPLAEDLTAEADSGGHTDNRTLSALLPSIAALRAEIIAERGYTRPIRLGAAGGLGTPAAVAAAFALGADFVQTGTVNQACVESGLDTGGRALLARAEMADVIMAPAADMFEMGVEVQVLRRGTMFAPRARKLYELYRAHASLDAIPQSERARLEKDILRESVDQAWESTATFWRDRDPAQLARAEAEPKHRMALLFRAYLGLSSRWAIDGKPERLADYQIWCGPAMGAFNTWVQGSFLQPPEAREVVQVARNLLEGAAVITRAQQLRSYGLPIPASAFDYRPRPLG